jgi:outer membrane protein
MDMKKVIFQILAVLAFAISLTSIGLQQINQKKIVYVNSSKLLDQYLGMVDARKEFQNTTSIWQAELDTMYASLTQRIEVYEKNVNSMTAEKARKEKENIELASKQLQQHRVAVNNKAKEEDARMTEEVVKEVNTFITEYCKNKGYRIVLGITQAGNLIYAKEEIDITDEVIVAINNNYRGTK